VDQKQNVNNLGIKEVEKEVNPVRVELEKVNGKLRDLELENDRLKSENERLERERLLDILRKPFPDFPNIDYHVDEF
jgi:regulator of replication initiation timing